jgi:type IV secretion system protein TrbL
VEQLKAMDGSSSLGFISRRIDMRSVKWILALAVVTVLVPEVWAQTYTTTVPTDILSQYRNARQLWTTNIWVYANSLFGLLAVIEFAWSAAVMLLEKADLQNWTSALVRKIMWIGAFYMLLINGRIWIPGIIDSFNQVGASAAGFAVTLSPGDIFSQGLTIAAALVDAATGSGFLTNPGTSISMALAALLIVLAYIVITLNFVVTVVESYVVVSVGFIFLGFGGSRWTAPYVERYIGLAVSIGVKIVLLYCLISAGLGLGNGWLDEAQGIGTSAHPNMTAFDVMGAALIFMMLCWQIPRLFSAVLGGAPALTGGDLISTGVMIGSAGVAVGSAIASGVGAAAAGAGAFGGASAGAASGASGPSGAANSVAGVSSAGSSGGGSAVPPPSTARGDSASTAGARQQPDPPPRGSSLSSLASVGGEPLGGSGFEGEKPTRGFASASSDADSDISSVEGRSSGAVVLPPPSNSTQLRRPQNSTSVKDRFDKFRRRLPSLPSDSAPHATPPRMPIDHQD